MTLEMWLALAIVVFPLGLVLAGHWRIDMAALVMMAALGLAQFFGLGMLGPAHTPENALLIISGFSQPVVITLIGLFILTQTLSITGLTQWIGLRLAHLGRGSERRLVFLFSGTAALLSLLLNNIAVGALLLPGAMQVSRRTQLAPSKLLIPIAFGTALGGMATYFTTANIVMSNLLLSATPPQAPLNFQSFFPTGGLIALAGLLYLMLASPRLLPERAPGPEQSLARHASTDLEGFYAISERLWECTVQPKSPLIGQNLQHSRIGELLGIVVVAIWRKKQAIFSPDASETIKEGDMLLVIGNEQRLQQLSHWGIQIGRDRQTTLSQLNVRLVELLLAPHSNYEGKTVKGMNFRRKYGFTAVALLRRGRSYRTDVGSMPLEPGDSLLMIGPPQRINDLRTDPDIITLEPEPPTPDLPRKRAIFSAVVLLASVMANLLGLPAYLAVIVGAVIVLVTRLISMAEAYRAIEMQVLFFIAGMYAASLAMINTGLTNLLAQSTIQITQGTGGLGLAAGAFLLATMLTQFIGSQATAFVIGPIAIHTATQLGLNPQAVAVATAIGCSASFLTPTSHPVNLLIMNPGNYRFGDFFRLGLGLFIVSLVALLMGLILFWNL
jgi:di/tricarboxylate transporter